VKMSDPRRAKARDGFILALIVLVCAALMIGVIGPFILDEALPVLLRLPPRSRVHMAMEATSRVHPGMPVGAAVRELSSARGFVRHRDCGRIGGPPRVWRHEFYYGAANHIDGAAVWLEADDPAESGRVVRLGLVDSMVC
jgi:hypothetical protein